ncbi:hypothetical protein [Eoetvoesiella caeni]|uniref:Uncharacterized protein n=1 Tax=Eoetvoesiella caeni TaxID=645616 RepID=A0A366GY07_9BURK|nr:hypothetical protein [Eoetvoesiella caeni]MCI2811299.1 hypothetical protein [Eoetvoesiella caeni]NYT57202.1 hypothetical protein [Eoetvoesiella caeni]RBP33625.1 hypothetical protein DFR37_12616 [Eoetvoesiella caeni]
MKQGLKAIRVDQINTKVIGSHEHDTGTILFHAEAELPGNYHTLCGISLDDDLFEPIEPPIDQKVNCAIRASAFGMPPCVLKPRILFNYADTYFPIRICP